MLRSQRSSRRFASASSRPQLTRASRIRTQGTMPGRTSRRLRPRSRPPAASRPSGRRSLRTQVAGTRTVLATNSRSVAIFAMATRASFGTSVDKHAARPPRRSGRRGRCQPARQRSQRHLLYLTVVEKATMPQPINHLSHCLPLEPFISHPFITKTDELLNETLDPSIFGTSVFVVARCQGEVGPEPQAPAL